MVVWWADPAKRVLCARYLLTNYAAARKKVEFVNVEIADSDREK